MMSRVLGSHIALLVAAGLGSPAAADILLVNAEGTGQYPTIQAAVDAAVDGDEVQLIAGTYTGDGNRFVDFLGKAITLRSQSGNPADVIVTPSDGMYELGRAFIFQSGETELSVLEGITISGGWADGPNDPAGIVRCIDASPTIRNCVFEYNYGSALAFSGAPLIQNCVFRDNFCIEGNGSGVNGSGNAIIEDCTFTGNSGENFGGAAFLAGATVRRCVFSENGVYYSGGSIHGGALIEDCVFSNGGATYYGGFISGGGTIRRCFFEGGGAEQGGAIFGAGVIESCTFVEFWGHRWGDAITVFAGAHATIMNSIIAFGHCYCNQDDMTPIHLREDATVDILCTDIYGNEAGDWVGPISDQLGKNGNISADPLFCDRDAGAFTLFGNSPCAPAHSNGCGLIGLYDVGCEPSSVEAKSWGKIKGMYR